MDVYPSMQRRRLLRAALGAAALTPLACSRVPAAAMATPVAPELLPLGPQITPDLFLTVTSQERDATTLALLVSTTVLPVLAPADIAHAAGPVEGAIQLWLTLDPVDLQHHGLDVDGALALLTQTLKGNAGPVPGRHRLKAWAIDIPGQETVDAQQVTLPLPDHPYAPMFALGTTEYTVVPPAWRNQSHFSCYLQSRGRLDTGFLQRCERLLQTAGNTLPADLDIQIGRIGDPLLTLPTLFVEVNNAR